MEHGLLPCGRAGIHFVHKLFTRAFVLFIPQDKRINKQFEPFVNRTPKRGGRH